MKTGNDIKIWWTDLLKKYKGFMGSGYDLIEYLDKYVGTLEQEDRQTIIEFLTDEAIDFKDGYVIAFSILEKYCNKTCLDKIYKCAQKVDFNDEKIIYPIRVLCKHGSDNHRQLLEKFFSPDKLNELETFVQWSLYPKFPDLFVKTYSKYLKLTDYKKWTGSGITQSFMYEPIALGLLKDHLLNTDKKTWEYVSKDIKTELTKNIWTEEQKIEIKKIIPAPNTRYKTLGFKWLFKRSATH
nr:hypothetical protein [uncultured Draconibacterium sp.]